VTCKNVLFAALAAACCAFNLSADVTGTILGTIRDSSNAIVVGAQVAATNIDTNFTRQVSSGSDGGYRLDSSSSSRQALKSR
jgi:hypothetical protein